MRPHVRLTLMRDAVELEGLGGRASTLGVSYPYDPDDLSAVVTAAVEALAIRRPRVEVRLARPLIQMRHLTGFPPVRRSRLAQLVGDRASAVFRRRKTALVLDAGWTTRKRNELVAAAASEPLVSAVVSAVEAAGGAVTAVCPAEDAGTTLTLLPRVARRQLQKRYRRAAVAAAVAASAVWSLAGVVYLWDLIADHRAVTEEMRALEEPVAQLADAREQVNEVAAMVQVIGRDVERRGWPVASIESVTTLLPDSAFLTRLLVSVDGRYELSGLAAFPDSVAKSLESALGRVGSSASRPLSDAPPNAEGWRPFHIVIAGANGGAR